MGLETKIKILCDSCERDISPFETQYPKHYILKLYCIDIALHNESSMIYSYMICPPIDKDLYFCGFMCVKNYCNSKL